MKAIAHLGIGALVHFIFWGAEFYGIYSVLMLIFWGPFLIYTFFWYVLVLVGIVFVVAFLMDFSVFTADKLEKLFYPSRFR